MNHGSSRIVFVKISKMSDTILHDKTPPYINFKLCHSICIGLKCRKALWNRMLRTTYHKEQMDSKDGPDVTLNHHRGPRGSKWITRISKTPNGTDLPKGLLDGTLGHK